MLELPLTQSPVREAEVVKAGRKLEVIRMESKIAEGREGEMLEVGTVEKAVRNPNQMQVLVAGKKL